MVQNLYTSIINKAETVRLWSGGPGSIAVSAAGVGVACFSCLWLGWNGAAALRRNYLLLVCVVGYFAKCTDWRSIAYGNGGALLREKAFISSAAVADEVALYSGLHRLMVDGMVVGWLISMGPRSAGLVWSGLVWSGVSLLKLCTNTKKQCNIITYVIILCVI